MTTLTEAFQRRVQAFFEPTEEFYDKNQPRDKDGQWTRIAGDSPGESRKSAVGPTSNKVWSGMSAHPDTRVRPKPSDDFQADNFKKIATRMYNADLGNGYYSKVVEVEEPSVGTLYVRGSIYNKGNNQVGSFERTIGFENGALVVTHDEFFIRPSHQGFGVGDRFNAHAIAAYQEYGVDRIVLTTGLLVGGFAWARQGFRHAGPGVRGTAERVPFLMRRLDGIDSLSTKIPIQRPFAARIKKETKALRKAIKAGEDIQPIHIASIGESYIKWTAKDENLNDYTTWPGKESLLGTAWKAEYLFDAANPVTAAASSLVHADLRPPFRSDRPVVRQLAAAFEAFAFNPSQPRDKEGQWTQYRAGITSLSRETLDRAIDKGAAGIFGGGVTGTTPWPRAPRIKGQRLYDPALVEAALRKPPVLEKVDPRTLFATQPGLVRHIVDYYSGDEYQRTGKVAADLHSASNAFPIVYVNAKGQNILLSGHHRAAADLVTGRELDAIVVREVSKEAFPNWPPDPTGKVQHRGVVINPETGRPILTGIYDFR